MQSHTARKCRSDSLSIISPAPKPEDFPLVIFPHCTCSPALLSSQPHTCPLPWFLEMSFSLTHSLKSRSSSFSCEENLHLRQRRPREGRRQAGEGALLVGLPSLPQLPNTCASPRSLGRKPSSFCPSGAEHLVASQRTSVSLSYRSSK